MMELQKSYAGLVKICQVMTVMSPSKKKSAVVALLKWKMDCRFRKLSPLSCQLLSAVGTLVTNCRHILTQCRLSLKPLGRPLYSPEPLAEVYCLRLNFNISKLIYWLFNVILPWLNVLQPVSMFCKYQFVWLQLQYRSPGEGMSHVICFWMGCSPMHIKLC